MDQEPAQFIRVDDELREVLNREIKGTGGFQSLLKKLQQQVYLVLTEDDVAKIKRDRDEYGRGGFQSLLRKLDIE